MRAIAIRPRGFCAGVDRAIDIVEEALQLFPAPLYVRREIVHNRIVVEGFKARGVVFVDELCEVPDGGVVIFSAHGVAPAVHAEARRRRLQVIDATCPLVTKVHLEVRRFVKQGYDIVLIGHAGHDEVLGTTGEAPAHIHLVGSVADVEALELPQTEKLVYLTQTTLSVDETRDIVAALQGRFPKLAGPPRDDICYATQNRQEAVKAMVGEGAQLVLVVGSQTSSNSIRLCEVARERGAAAHLIDGVNDIDPAWLEGVIAGRGHCRSLGTRAPRAGSPRLAARARCHRRGARPHPRGRAVRAAAGVARRAAGAPESVRPRGKPLPLPHSPPAAPIPSRSRCKPLLAVAHEALDAGQEPRRRRWASSIISSTEPPVRQRSSQSGVMAYSAAMRWAIQSDMVRRPRLR